MIYNLAVTPTAFSDILDASVYYENILPKLSERFLLELSDVYHRLAVNPQHFGFIPSKKKSSLRSSQIKAFRTW